MKKLLLLIPVLCFTVMAHAGTNGTAEENEGGTKLNLWIPGFLVQFAADIAEKHVDGEEQAAMHLVQHIGGINVCIREGDAYLDKTDKKMTRKIGKMDKKNYEPLVKVNSSDAKVDLRIKENKKGVIKRMVVLVDEPGETFVYVKMHCRFSNDEIAYICRQYM
ncbi:MAG: DUF4252 domain-containing protein [Chitinophagales bacterium]